MLERMPEDDGGPGPVALDGRKRLVAEVLSMTQDLVVAAVNAGLTKSGEMVDKELEKVTGGLKIPGLM